eukprot:COSAG02_NODE_474_length_21578_cov_225.787746_10_plen_125_part_00
MASEQAQGYGAAEVAARPYALWVADSDFAGSVEQQEPSYPKSLAEHCWDVGALFELGFAQLNRPILELDENLQRRDFTRKVNDAGLAYTRAVQYVYVAMGVSGVGRHVQREPRFAFPRCRPAFS